jgi:DNA-directed RNA polymerase subunit RPC12/RpoP
LFLLNKKAFTFEYIRDQKELYIPVKIPINPKIPPKSDNYQAQLTDGWILRAALIPELQNVFDEVVNFSDTHRKSLTEREKTLEKAKNYEMAYRMEEAAKIYEELGLWAEAGRVRKKAQETITKNLTVDVNQLLEQLREGNISTTYNCANCGADIAIDGKTDANGLRFCNFCGSAIKIQDLTEVIQKVI